MDKIALSDIRDEATRNLFADLMESEGKTRVLMYSMLISIIGGLGLFNILLFMPLFQGIRGFYWTVAPEMVFVFTILMLVLNNTIYEKWYVHDTIYRVKLPVADYQDRIGKWLIAENSNRRKLGANVFRLKPNQKYYLFYTILYAIQDDYAIVLAPKRRLSSFMKVFE